MTVPQTDTGGLVENTKAIEKTISKELGKTAGRKLCKMPFLPQGRTQRKSLKRLFNKNTGLCKPERGSIGPEA